MKKNTKTKIIQIIALFVMSGMLLVLMSACTASEEPSTSEPPEAEIQETAPPFSEQETEPEPESQILRFGVTGLSGMFNPIMAFDINDLYVTSLIFEPLITTSHDGTAIPHLANWTISNNNLTYIFTLKEGITFSDGTPMTSSDVAFTFLTMCHPDYSGPRSYAVSSLLGYTEFKSGAIDELPGIVIIDERTIAFHILEGMENAANIWNFAYGIMPMHIYAFETWDEFITKLDAPVGSGKFILDEWKPGESISLLRNDNYWSASEIPLLEAVFMPIISEDDLYSAIQNNEIDMAKPRATPDNYYLFSSLTNADLRIIPRNSYKFLQFNTLRLQLNDVRVRQALIYALDRQTYIYSQMGSLGSLGMAPISPSSWAFPNFGLNSYLFDIAKANALMQEAGWFPGDDGILTRDGIRMELEWLVYTDTDWPAILAAFAKDSWRQIGVELTVTAMSFEELNARTFGAEPNDIDFDVFAMGFIFANDPDPTGGLFDHDAFITGGFNVSGYYNTRAQELIALGRNTFNQTERAAIYHEWAKIMNESIPTVIIAYRSNIWVTSNRVEGMFIGPYWEWWRNISTITLN